MQSWSTTKTHLVKYAIKSVSVVVLVTAIPEGIHSDTLTVIPGGLELFIP